MKRSSLVLCGWLRVLGLIVAAWFLPSVSAAEISKIDRSGNAQHTAYCSKSASIIFLGDSITRYFQYNYYGQATWAKYFGDGTGRSAESFGIAGDTVGGLWWRVDEGGELDGFTAEKIVILIGTNNLKDNSAAEIVTGISNLVATVCVKQPTAQIVLTGILPRTESLSGGIYEQKVADVNAALSTFPACFSNLNYLDVSSKLVENGALKEGCYVDGLHPLDPGYEAWMSELMPLLDGTPPDTEDPDSGESSDDDYTVGNDAFLESSDLTMRHRADGNRQVYVFTNTAAAVTVTLKQKASGYRYLVCGGGGAGGSTIGGGGGGGGVVTATVDTELAAGTTLSIKVGAGAKTDPGNPYYAGNDGAASSLQISSGAAIIAYGGGGGGGWSQAAGHGYTAQKPVASGGGGSHAGSGGAGFTGQGFKGGNAVGSANNQSPGGGGGASAPGEDGETTGDNCAGKGGEGLVSNITGKDEVYGSGGGGGTGNACKTFGAGGTNAGDGTKFGTGLRGGSGVDGFGGGGGGGGYDYNVTGYDLHGGFGGNGTVILSLVFAEGGNPGTDEPGTDDPSTDDPGAEYHDEEGTPVAEPCEVVADTREDLSWGYKYQVKDLDERIYQLVVITQANAVVNCEVPGNETIEYLMIGGGGGAGATANAAGGAGGGAGAVIYDFMSFSTAATLAFTVGKGGVSRGQEYNTTHKGVGETGGDTTMSFNDEVIRCAPGGGGGAYGNSNLAGIDSVGSGGGGAKGGAGGKHLEGTGASAGAIGYEGATGSTSAGAGGGGAGGAAPSAGAASSEATGNHGGAGVVYYITGEPQGYAAGGAGKYGRGGSVIINSGVVRIGGDATYLSNYSAPKPNTGSGAGPCYSSPVTPGADGVVILRYLAVTDTRIPIEKPSLSAGSCQYDDENHRPEVAESEGYEVAYHPACDWIQVGNYSITVTLKEGYKWSDNTDKPLTLDFKILGASVDKPAFISDSVPYDGEEHTQTVPANDGYSVVYSAEHWVEPGDYTATVTLKSGYMWVDETFEPLTLRFSIVQGPTETTGERIDGSTASESWGESYLLLDSEQIYRIIKVTQQGTDVRLMVPQGVRIEYLLVGGGGGAGKTVAAQSGAGGGAGAVLSDYLTFDSATEITLCVGAGGVTKSVSPYTGDDGQVTTMRTNGVEVLRAPGGGGGAFGNGDRSNGASSVGSGGGGAKLGAGGEHLEGMGTSAGAIGNDGATAGATGGAGGGGAGGAAPTVTSPTDGNGCDGGPGKVYYITGEPQGYAAGGGGRFGRGGSVTINGETVRIGGDFGYYSKDFVGPLANSGSGAGSAGSSGENLMPGADGVAVLRYKLGSSALPALSAASLTVTDAAAGAVAVTATVPWLGGEEACDLVLKYGKTPGVYSRQTVVCAGASAGEIEGTATISRGTWYGVLVARTAAGESSASEEFQFVSEKPQQGTIIYFK